MNFDLVPQVFYDLIARIVPGFVVAAAWYLAVRDTAKWTKDISDVLAMPNVTSIGSLLLLIAFAYVFGFILRELWSLVFKRKSDKRTDSDHPRYKKRG